MKRAFSTRAQSRIPKPGGTFNDLSVSNGPSASGSGISSVFLTDAGVANAAAAGGGAAGAADGGASPLPPPHALTRNGKHMAAKTYSEYGRRFALQIFNRFIFNGNKNFAINSDHKPAH
ncbi:MAG: hypothetical protein A3I66_06450 [Burkholderiales bacterium RIFCSPLOWO2_02_FULL_57_36]|nr:MAG: hypothetical protein A3I66_06450 [Burkholderiales bacterium RIFCSPLOWO2_02_FULL_57_36]